MCYCDIEVDRQREPCYFSQDVTVHIVNVQHRGLLPDNAAHRVHNVKWHCVPAIRPACTRLPRFVRYFWHENAVFGLAQSPHEEYRECASIEEKTHYILHLVLFGVVCVFDDELLLRVLKLVNIHPAHGASATDRTQREEGQQPWVLCVLRVRLSRIEIPHTIVPTRLSWQPLRPLTNAYTSHHPRCIIHYRSNLLINLDNHTLPSV